jgi:integrase/recombinase XerD
MTHIVNECFKTIKPPKQADRAITAEKYLSKSNLELLQVVKLTKKQRALVFFLAYTGLRISEAINITLDDIKRSNDNNVSIIRVIGKGNKERFIYAPNILIEAIKLAYMPQNNLLININRQSAYKTIRGAMSKIGLKLSPHSMRHTFATNAIKEGKRSIKAVAKQLGHSSTNITNDFYNHDSFEASDFNMEGFF